MRYSGYVTVPAGTPKSAPVSALVPVGFGRIRHLRVLPPPGCAGLVHLIVRYHTAQIYPTSPEADFIGDGEPIEFGDSYPIFDDPLEVELVAWSPDATLEHTIYAQFTVERDQPVEIFFPASPELPGVSK